MILNHSDMAIAFNEAFQTVQKSVPYNTPNRDSALCAKYAMYIGVLEGLLKLHTLASNRSDMVKTLNEMVKQVEKI